MKANIETAQEYIKITTRIDMDYIHSTLQKCLSGNIDELMINESLELIKKYKLYTFNQ